MTPEATRAYLQIRDCLDEQLHLLIATDFRDVLEALAGDIDGMLDALEEDGTLAEDE